MLVAVASLTVLAGVLRFAGLGTQSLWFDEALTAIVLDSSLAETFETLRDREATPPLYYALAWVWTQALGEGDVALRSLSALLGTATVPAVYVAGMRLASQRTGIVAAALVAVSPYLIWYSQEARSYALAMLLAALSLVFLAGAVERRGRDLVLWAVTVSLLLATHYFSAILIAAEALWLLHRRGLERPLLGAFARTVATGLLLAPLALTQEHADWIADLDSRPASTRRRASSSAASAARPGSGLGLAAGLLVVAGLALLLWRARDQEREGGLLALGLVAFAFAVSLLLAAVGLDYVYHRNFLVLWIPLAMAVAAGLRRGEDGGARGGGLLCAAPAREPHRDRARRGPAPGGLGGGGEGATARATEPRPTAVWPPYADAPLIHYGIPLVEEIRPRARARDRRGRPVHGRHEGRAGPAHRPVPGGRAQHPPLGHHGDPPRRAAAEGRAGRHRPRREPGRAPVPRVSGSRRRRARRRPTRAATGAGSAAA